MSATTNRRPLAVVAVVLAVVALAALASQRGDAADPYGTDRPLDLRFDIAEDGTRFAFDAAPVFDDDGMPAAGNEFVTHGFIYPDGTLSGSDGVVVDADGTAAPEVPDAVIGEWICYGTFIDDGAHETDDPWS